LRPLLLSLVVIGCAALAQVRGPATAAWAASDASDAERAVRHAFELATGPGDADERARAEYELASSLQRAGLPFAAFIYFTPLVRAGPGHPHHLEAVQGLVALQEQLEDDALIPSVLNGTYDRFSEAWRKLPPEALARINYLIGRVAHRKGLLDEARQFLEAVPSSSRSGARARVLLGVTLADPRFPAAEASARRATLERAAETFRSVLQSEANLDSPVRQLALLGLARVSYNLGDHAEATRRYDEVPASSRYRDQALFENGFARFQNDDPGGALGTLLALQAPQFAQAFQPEAPILAATVYYFACLHEEALSALEAFDARYAPMADQLAAVLKAPAPAAGPLLAQLRPGAETSIPPAVVSWVRSSHRIEGLIHVLSEAEREAKAVRERRAWASTPLGDELGGSLEQYRATLEQVAATAVLSRLDEASRSLRGFADQAEILRFEVAKAQKEAAEAGADTRAMLDGQRLLRPALPSDHHDAWPFQGEFWRDEVGAYQYTLKRGCVEVR
jgi:tetratricopeptide (TPR) repeat protein